LFNPLLFFLYMIEQHAMITHLPIGI
jgi:hypothetical protein